MNVICFAGWHKGYSSGSLEGPFWICEVADVQARRLPGPPLLSLMYRPQMHVQHVTYLTEAQVVQIADKLLIMVAL